MPIDRGPPMVRKAFVVTEAVREKVRHLAGIGVPQDDIARIIGCAPKTLRKRCRGPRQRRRRGQCVGRRVFCSRANWRERALPEHPPADSGPEASSPVVLLLPDNSRDPDLTQALRGTRKKHAPRKLRR